MLVQAVERLVLRFQPLLEFLFGEVVIRRLGVFIVNLPADDVGIVAIALGHFSRDLTAEFAIALAGEGKMLAVSVNRAASIHPHAKDVWILLGHPCRRRRGRRSQDDGDMMLRSFGNRVIEPIEIELPLRWLHPAPRKFADARKR